MIELPFFTPEHRNLAQSVAQFAAREIEPHAGVEEDVDGLVQHFVSLLASAGLLSYAVAESRLDIRSLCLIREELSYASPLAD
ncbi:MAG TPA: acyl-CoA dehydrogenase family protein, partial [Pyrinomonadaceae bacterium]